MMTPEQKLKAAYFHLVRGIDQHVLADVYEVNQGRINEAVQAARKAFDFPTRIEDE